MPRRASSSSPSSDIQDAADVFRPVYESTEAARRIRQHRSIALPRQRHEAASLEEARRLWKSVGRENVMIKIPGDRRGPPGDPQAISEGINVNITLLFAQDVYEKWRTPISQGLKHSRATVATSARRQRRQLLYQPHRLRRGCHHRDPAQGGERCPRTNN